MKPKVIIQIRYYDARREICADFYTNDYKIYTTLFMRIQQNIHYIKRLKKYES